MKRKNFIKKFFDRFALYLPAIISGILLGLSFPKADLSFLAWFSIVPLLVFLHDKDKKESFIAGFITGVFYFFITIYWIYHSINHYGSIHFVPSILLVFLLSCYLSLYVAVFSLLYSYQIKRTTIPSMVIAPFFWVTLEYIRSFLLTGFPWSSIGYSQYSFSTLIQVSDLIGVYGISFLVISINGAITDALLYKKRKTERPLMQVYPTFVSLSVICLIFISVFIYGIVKINSKIEGQRIKVAVIQGNIEQDKKWDHNFQSYVMNVYKSLTLDSLKYSPDMIIWPETALPFYFDYDKQLTDDLIGFQGQTNSYLLLGSMMIKPDRDNKKKVIYTNSAILFDKNAKISYIYDKIHLVPFGEYVPLRKVLFFINKLTYGIGDYTPGDIHLKAITPFGSFGTVICYEIIFPDLVRKFFVKDGANFLVNITNDAWFGTTSGPYQHFNMAIFRAIENRKPVVRVANTGISGYIDSKGKVVSSTELFKQTFAVYEIETNKTTTFYTKNGDLLIYFSFVITIILLLRKNKIGGLE